LGSVTPGQQLVQPDDLVVSDAGEDVPEPGLRVDVVHFGGFDQSVGDGHGLAAAFGAGEGPDAMTVLAADFPPSGCAFSGE
jgi:hypothetical protein